MNIYQDIVLNTAKMRDFHHRATLNEASLEGCQLCTLYDHPTVVSLFKKSDGINAKIYVPKRESTCGS